MFVDNTKLGLSVDLLEGWKGLQRDLDKQSMGQGNCMMFKKAKCQVLRLGHDNSMQYYRLSGESLESSPAEKDLGMLMNGQANVSQQYG